MLDIIEFGKDEYAFPSLVVLGCFDAIHVGHRELFKKAKLQAKINGLDLGVMMFREGKGGKQIYSFEERVKMVESYNVKFVLAIDFTPEFMQTMPLDFLSAIEEKINVKAYMSGKDFRFGKGAKGKSSTLKNYADDEENGVWYMPVKDVMSDGQKISTTLIKSCLDEGDVKRASELLGENFYIEGQVVEGAHRGTGVLGFPTVNINYPDWKYPVKHGVYKVSVTVDGNVHLGIANFGGRPTFGEDSEVLEVHIKDFDGDLYGKTIKISFVGYMRSIRKFADAQALAVQLEQDKSALNLSDEQFFALYPLEETEPAIEEQVDAELAEESAPPAEVIEDAPVVEPEAEVVAAPEESISEENVEILSHDQIVLPPEALDIVPAWKLLNEPYDLRITEYATVHTDISEEIEQVDLGDEVTGPSEETVGEAVEEPAAEDVEEESVVQFSEDVGGETVGQPEEDADDSADDSKTEEEIHNND